MPIVSFVAVLGFAQHAHALTVAAPIGGDAIVLPARHVLCEANQDLGGWRLEAQGTRLRPPRRTATPGQVILKTATSMAACAVTPMPLVLQSVANWPTIKASSVVYNVDVGRVDIAGSDLKDVVLQWQVGSHQGTDTCRDPQGAAGFENCAFSVERELSADISQMRLSWLPAGIPPGDDVLAFDAKGRKMTSAHFMLSVAKVVVVDLLIPETTLDTASDVGRLALRHPEAIDHVSCKNATCDLDGRDLVVKGVRGIEEGLEVRPVLRPHVFLQGASQLQTTPILVVPLQHCPISLASSTPLRGIAGQKLVMQVGGRCRSDGDLRFFVGGSPSRVVSSRTEGDTMYAVLHTDVVLGDDVTVVVQRKNSIAGMVRSPTRVMPSVRSRIALVDYGMIDFLPSNRPAEVMLPSLGEGATLVPLPVAGVYTITTDARGVHLIQGIQGATGWVALRLAYRDQNLPVALRDTNLAELTDTVDRSIHAASIPMSLGASSMGDTPIVELQCTDLAGVPKRITPAQPVNINYQQRDSCRLVLHRERLKPEDGDQLVRVTVNVAALDGKVRPEAAIDQRVLLRPGNEPRYLFIGGVLAPFDRIVTRVSVITEDLHESVAAIGQAERVNLAQVQWSLTVANNRIRLYATTAMPTGLFRVADKGHSGLMGLNAGILSRLVLLTHVGVQAPIALELGVMVLGITGDTTPSPRGHVAAVGGLSLSVPIANVSQSTQAAISLHAWAEYEVSRLFLANAGSPWGFVFGPSLSFGDVGVNL